MTMDRSPGCAGCGQAPLAAPAAEAGEIGRRTFLAQSAMLAAAAALAACGAATTSPSIPSGTSINVNDYAALRADGGVALVTLGGTPVAVVRTSAASYVVLSRVCPHQGGIVNPNGAGFLCPNHGAMFSLTGQWQGGQRTTNLHSYPTSYNAASGALTIG